MCERQHRRTIGAWKKGRGPAREYPLPYAVTGMSFSFTGIGVIPPCSAGASDVARCDFLNESGVDWTSLTLSINPVSEQVLCASLFGYDSCAVQQGSAQLTSVLRFSGGPGIRAGELLTFSGSGWPTVTTFTAVVNDVPGGIPEPSTIALMLSGIAVIATLRRRRG